MTSHNTEGGLLIRIEAYEPIPYLMLFFGSIALISSVFSSSYILAFVGMALTFWGALFLYIKPTKYVKLELLEATSISALLNIERILVRAKANLKGVYLPPGRFKGSTTCIIFVPKRINQPLPTTEESFPEKSQFENPSGLFITPPGLALSELFEKQLKKPFVQASLEDLQNQLPKVFADLQIAKSLTIQGEGNTITVKVRNHVFEHLCEETAKLELTQKLVGCPLSSAIACVFAKATGKPLVIETEAMDQDETTTIRYRLLED